jgi:hypothetical protein
MAEHTDDSRSVAEQVADDLKDTFAALGVSSIPAEDRATMQRRLLAITTTSKRDVVRAHEQLRRLRDDLRAAQRATESSEDE